MLFGLLVGPVQQLLAAEGGGGLPRQLLLLVLVHAELPHEALVLPEPGQSEVAPAEGALGVLLPGHGVDALLAGGVVAGADDQGRPLPGVEADVADLADDVLLVVDMPLRGMPFHASTTHYFIYCNYLKI